MRQQQGAYPVQRRASRPQQPPARRQQYPPANPHYSGHSAGIHPEDQPYLSGDVEEVEEDESYYVTRPHTSARRYVEPQPQVIQRGNKRLVIHQGSPPRILRFHKLTYLGLAMIIMLTGYMLVTLLGVFWQNKQDDWNFGNPRTMQTDAVIGHSDSTSNPSHFIAENLRGQIIVTEYPGGNVSKAHVYSITVLQSGDGSVPVTVSLRDINGDGKPDMLVTIGDTGSNQFTVFLFNNGSQFVSKL